ncbi:MAG: tRNA lysidine(34) synthetase TilS [Oscillospiraceae bacterium]|nr:tRNA lysidine(34) synthetase TilS [Oscillospiraceae bacterium]
MMLDKILNFSMKYKMFPQGCKVICGLSGGADSVSLLLSLLELRDKLDISEISAIHVNHCLRGEESDRDEDYCRQLCRSLSVEFTAISCDVSGYAEKNGISTEESARILRYGIFEKYSAGNEKNIIATAHNANDNLETVIHNLTRGSALKGLCGIPPVRDNIVRPLLTVSREEIEIFLKNKNISFVTDSTNLSDDYTRNRIRHNVLPSLEDINKSVLKTSARSLEVLRLENDFIEQEVQKARKKCQINNFSKFSGLSEFHKVIRQRCLAEYLSEHNFPYDFKRLEKLDDIVMNGGKLNISEDLYFVSDGTVSEFRIIPDTKNPEELSSPLKIGINSIFDSIIVTAEIISRDMFELNYTTNRSLEIYYMDYDKIKGKMILRNRRNGDKIRLAGRNFTSSVKKLINERIEPDKKPFLHFIDDEFGTLLAEKIGVADRVKVDKNTSKILKIMIRKAGL